MTAAARIAALPMYDLPGLEVAHDDLWRFVARRLAEAGLADVPPTLTRDMPLAALWHDPRLLLAQSCGYPLTTSLQGKVRLVATPRYRAPGCNGPLHRSAVVVRGDDDVSDLAALRGRRCAINAGDSNSGMNLLRAVIAPLAGGAPFFGAVLLSGSHRRSTAMVASGEADVAAIDSVTLAHLQRLAPALTARVRVLCWTDWSPGLPFVTAATTDDATLAALRAALVAAAVKPSLERQCSALLLDGFEILPDAAYDEILVQEQLAAALGYRELL